MADRINFSVSVTPIETLADEQANDHDVISGEVGTTLGGSGDSISLAGYTTRNAVQQGYLNATVNYLDTAFTGAGTVLTAAGVSDFFFIKNTGFKYSSATALGAASTDCIMVSIQVLGWDADRSGWGVLSTGTAETHYIGIAWLKPGQAIVLPQLTGVITQYGAAANDFSDLNYQTAENFRGVPKICVKTFESDGTAASDGNAVEMLSVT